jgi:PAS domain S-box-containing protein
MSRDETIAGLKAEAAGLRERLAKLEAAGAGMPGDAERFRAAFEQAPVGIVQGDLRGKQRLANRRAREMFGYQEESEFVALRLWDCTHPEDLWTVDRFKRLLAGEIEDYTLEKRYLRRGGEVWWARVNASLVRDGQGRAHYFMVILEDITARRHAEEELRRSQGRLEARVAERTAELKEANTALKVLLDRRAQEKAELEDKVAANAQQLVVPFLDRLRASGLNAQQKALAEAAAAGLAEITSGFARRLTGPLVGLTPKELEVARLVKEGRSSTEIGDMLSLSEHAVAFHRHNIRSKLGLTRRRVNLCSYLQQLSD